MKHNKLTFQMIVAALIALPLALSSCDKGDDKPDHEDPEQPADSSSSKPEYAIIYYGHGGGDLDIELLENISDLFGGDRDSYKKVSAAVQYKMSGRQGLREAMEWGDFGEDFDIDKYAHKTFRFVVDTARTFEDMFLGDLTGITLADQDLDIAQAESLADFMKWAAGQCPAQKYVLVVSDHGGGYSPDDDLPEGKTLSKGLLYDDGAAYDHLTVQKLTRAISESGIRPEAIYLDACLMNTIEYQYELKDMADYLVLSSFSVPGPGGDYAALVNELAKNADIEGALTNFCKACVSRWDGEYDEENAEPMYPYSDMSVIRTASIDAFGDKWTEFTSRLLSAYNDNDAKAAIDKATSEAYAMELGYPLYDMVDYAKRIMSALPAHFDESFAHSLIDAYKGTLVCSKASSQLEKYGHEIGCSILLGCNGHYTSHSWTVNDDDELTMDGYVWYNADGSMLFFDNDGNQYDNMDWHGTFADTYNQLKFDQKTGWSGWLEANEQEASPYSPAGMYAEITEDGFAVGDATAYAKSRRKKW